MAILGNANIFLGLFGGTISSKPWDATLAGYLSSPNTKEGELLATYLTSNGVPSSLRFDQLISDDRWFNTIGNAVETLNLTLEAKEEVKSTNTYGGTIGKYFGVSDGQTYGGGVTSVTYTQLKDLITANNLQVGSYYLITDFKTCYDRPDYNQFKNPIGVSTDSYFQGPVQPIIVLATSQNTLAVDAYQPTYPKDKIKYDVNYGNTESGGVAFGRITERIDEYNNRTDYDHRVIEFKRYRFHYYNRYTPQTGTIELSVDGTVTGNGTSFNSYSVGNYIAVPSSNEVFYRITNITSDTLMAVTGLTIGGTPGGTTFYSASISGYDSYYRCNTTDVSDFQLYTTFGDAISNEAAFNNYIGDYSLPHVEWGTGDFLLANNVFKSGEYINNKIGDSSYNNTFNDDCTNNTIGNYFYNNITDDDFDGNDIGNYFYRNLITANFQYNQIGENFYDNIIINSSFYRNQIGNDFRDNWIDSYWGFSFQNNIISNEFNNNYIYKAFYKNNIGPGYNNNNIYSEFEGNKIGAGFNNNSIYYNNFYNNEINNYFNNNNLGESANIGNGNFYSNKIGDYFQSNLHSGTCYNNQIMNYFSNNVFRNEFVNNNIKTNFSGNNIDPYFGFNQIGDSFQNNIIGDGFGYGGGVPRGNIVGNSFTNNTVGEYFYDNFIIDSFQTNTIVDGFKFNQVLCQVSNTDFSSATHVYADYNCRIVKSNDTNKYLEYLNVTTPTYVVPTA